MAYYRSYLCCKLSLSCVIAFLVRLSTTVIRC
uniref:Uncharacterized protein n=1 Tax=Arundo donax TaxID=35708 RepID=A0A0A9GM63_ARUDO